MDPHVGFDPGKTCYINLNKFDGFLAYNFVRSHIKQYQTISNQAIKSPSSHLPTLSISPNLLQSQEMHFECQVEAADALSRFAQGVGLLVQWQQELFFPISMVIPQLNAD